MMTDTDARTGEIARYVAEVRAALAHLPEETRTELVEDLPTHLAEVTADAPGPLEELLGPPQRYAAELCTSAGFDIHRPQSPNRPSDVMQRLQELDTTLGRWLGYPRLVDFLAALQPAWWVVRGALVGGMAFAVAFLALRGLPPVLGVAFLALGAVVSVRLGRTMSQLPRWGQTSIVVLNVLLIAYLLLNGLSLLY